MNDPKAVAADIARHLNETDPKALSQLERLVERAGEERARAFLIEALRLQAEGGLLTADGRRRSLGGVYFYIAKGRLSNWRDKCYIWPHLRRRKTPPFTWQERLKIAPQLLQEKGEITRVKITLTGRPGKIIEKGNLTLTGMQSRKAPQLPKGLPAPPAEATVYIVYIARKQWRKVAEAIKDPQDLLIVEGYPFFDRRLQAMSVFAQSVTTRQLQRAKGDSQRQKGG